MKILLYKNTIPFDDYTKNDDGEYWAEMCSECYKKYVGIVESDVDDGDTAIGYCSCYGCYNKSQDDNLHFYIDFKSKHIVFKNN